MKSTVRLRSFLSIASSALLTISYSHAATLYWDANAGTTLQTDGAGVWLTASQWWNGASNVNFADGDSVIFGNGGAGGAVTLASSSIVGSLTFNYFTGTYTLGTAGNAITLNSGITKNAGAGAVTFQGASPITLSAAQTFTNNSATTLTIGALDLNGNALTFSGTGITTFDGNVANDLIGAGGIIKNGTGTLILDSGTANTHTFTGGITVNGGVVFFQTAANVSGRGNVTLNDGYLEGRFGSSPTFAGGLGTGATAIQILGGTSGFSGQGGTTSTFLIGSALSVLKWGATGENGATGFFNPTVFVATGSTNANAKGSLNNGIDLNGTTRTITSLQTNGDGATSTGFTISGAIVNTAGSAAGLIKTGAGALILGAANTYNGSTSIQGGSIILSAAAAAINSTTSLGLSGGGALRLVNTAQVNRFADAAAITVSSGGGIDYINTAGANLNYTETLGSVTVSGGLLNVNLATNQNNVTNNSQTLTFGTAGSGNLAQSGTGSVAFAAAGTGPQASGNDNMIVVFGSGTTTAGEIVGPWATTGTTTTLQTDYAVYSGDYVVPAAIASSAESTWSTAHAVGSNYTLVNAAGTATNGRLTATRNINSVRVNSASNAITSVDFATNDTITITGSTFANGDVVTLGGTAPAGLTNGQPYYVVGASGDTFSLAATSGGTKINLTGAGTSPTITAGITLSTGNNLGTFGILNAQSTGMVIGGSGTGVVTLPTTSAGNLYVTAAGTSATSIGVPIADNTGALTLVKNGASTLRLYRANTYTGDTIINSGILQVGVNGLATGATLGNSGTYAGDIFIGAGAQLDFQTDSSQTLSGDISGDGALLKRYNGTLTLTGANTYTGKTTIGAITNSGDMTLVVSSFNSVSNPVASSSLGRPTTVANGTIEIGSNNSSPNPTLKYVGTGEITDRVINITFNSGALRTLDASGPSGLLKFTSAFTGSTTTGGLVLRGTGAGEITQGLPFAFLNLTKSDAGTWTLGGAVGSTGLITVNAGTLALQKRVSLQGGLQSNWTAAKINVKSAATLALNVDSADVDGLSATSLDTLLTNISVAGSAAAGLQAGAKLGLDTSTATGGTFTQGNLIANSTGANGGAIHLTKLGTGTLILDKANTYTGATAVNAGTLLVNGSTHASSAVTVAAGTLTGTPVATLGGMGTIGGNVSLTAESALGFKNGGVLAPTAAASGTALSVTGTTTFTTGSLFEWNMAATTPATDPGVVANSGSYGQLAGTGAITGSNAVFNIVLGAGNAFTDNFWNSDKSWTDVFTGAGATLDLEDIFASFGGTGVSTTGVVAGQGQFSFTGTSTLNWTYSAVPEPTSALAGLLLGAGLLRRRRA